MNYECSLKKVRGVTRCYVLQIEDDDSDEDSDDSDDDSDDVDDDISRLVLSVRASDLDHDHHLTPLVVSVAHWWPGTGLAMPALACVRCQYSTDHPPAHTM